MLHLERVPAEACVVVANHSSYLDGIVLFAALPPVFGFVIKREMSRVPLANLLLRQIGAHFVDRGQGNKGARDTRKLLKQAASGGSLAFFPEGTFHTTPGLMRFRAGAFLVAARAGFPVLPVAIRGSRQALPPGTFLPNPGTHRNRTHDAHSCARLHGRSGHFGRAPRRAPGHPGKDERAGSGARGHRIAARRPAPT